MARTRKRIRYFDLEKIERHRDDEPLAPSELEVLDHLTYDPWEAVDARLVVEEALQRLTSRQRHVLQGHLRGETLTAIARRLQVSIPTVHEIAVAARQALKKVLEEDSA